MKKGLIFGVLAFAFIFCSAFVFADSVGPTINITKVVPTVNSVSVIFLPGDSDGIKNCSLNVLPGNIKGYSEPNSSKVYRIVVKNLIANMSYTGIIECFDSLENSELSKPFDFVTNGTLKIVNMTKQPLNVSNNPSVTVYSKNSSGQILGMIMGAVLLIILVAIVLVIMKLSSKNK